MELQADFWYRQHQFKEAKSEALRAAEVYEKLGATNDLERCGRNLQGIEQDMKTRLPDISVVSPPKTCYFLHPPTLQSSVTSLGNRMMGSVITLISLDASFRGPPTPRVEYSDAPPLPSYSSSFSLSSCSPLFFPRTPPPMLVNLLYPRSTFVVPRLSVGPPPTLCLPVSHVTFVSLLYLSSDSLVVVVKESDLHCIPQWISVWANVVESVSMWGCFPVTPIEELQLWRRRQVVVEN